MANIVRGSASAVVALVLPHFLTRALDHDQFAAWVLMLQIAGYANYLDFGLQTAVARYLAQSIERGDEEGRDRLISTAILMLSAGALIALLVSALVLVYLPQLFPQIPASLLFESRGGILVLSLSTAVLLPLSAFTGALIGICRNEIPAISIGTSRLVGALFISMIVANTHSLIALASLMGGFNLAGGLLQLVFARRLLPNMKVSLSRVSRTTATEFARYCSTLTIWSLGMLLVSGLDVTIVGHFSFSEVGAYSIAAILITFLTGINNSVYGAMLAPLAVLEERGEWQRIGNVIVTVTRFTTFFDITCVLGAVLFGHWLLQLWVGDNYAAKALQILLILIVAHTIRLVGVPLLAALAATNQQHYGLSGSIVEALTNFALSIPGAVLIGSLGVAFATLVGAIISILWLLFFTIGRLRIQLVSRRELLLEGCLRPALCLSPAFLCVMAWQALPLSVWRSLGIATGLVLTLAVTWRWGQLWSSQSGSAA
jgi:O-antigen/teichoic acid export membrane protein